ncbi:hypothetical protein [Kitasatospora sp. NBC_01302]|uniref:hypothetical protein n=1 Tax=Kitasatospora sp. NBC_01302 TaxID=2903575 RepID=UPI002E12E4B6|nr:hypothetical protein OG294_37890 [Kitasatospora sp. NBC_01302]
MAAAGLAVDAAVHARPAGQYDTVSATVGEGDLFRAAAAAAVLSALLVLRRRRRPGDIVALLVAAAGLAAILVHRRTGIGAIGPLPNMYEPIWSSDKAAAAWAQGIAILALSVLVAWPRGRSTPVSRTSVRRARSRLRTRSTPRYRPHGHRPGPDAARSGIPLGRTPARAPG